MLFQKTNSNNKTTRPAPQLKAVPSSVRSRLRLKSFFALVRNDNFYLLGRELVGAGGLPFRPASLDGRGSGGGGFESSRVSKRSSVPQPCTGCSLPGVLGHRVHSHPTTVTRAGNNESIKSTSIYPGLTEHFGQFQGSVGKGEQGCRRRIPSLCEQRRQLSPSSAVCLDC